MKKIFTGILSIALAASMSVPAFAANTATNNGTAGTDITITGIYQAGSASAEVISVDLLWENMDFTYTAPSKGTWNPESHSYDGATAGGWAATNGTDPKISVTNHSNTEIKADFAFTSGIEGLNGSFTKDSIILNTAVGTERDNAPKDETAFSVDGTAIDADKALGTITVTVAKNDSETMYKVTAEQFTNLMETSNNFTVTAASGDDSMTIYFGGRSIMTNALGYYNAIYTFDGTNYYIYKQDEAGSDWLLEDDIAQVYDQLWSLANYLPYLKDSYASFAYDAATHTYKSTGAFTMLNGMQVTAASVGFENDALKSTSITLDNGMVYTYSECGTTVVEIPTNIHEHTFADTWSYNDYFHWHAATCRHNNEEGDKADHTFENGTCTVCGYTQSTR